MEESKNKSKSESEMSVAPVTKKRKREIVCITCGKTDVDFSKSQKRRYKSGKDAECKKCVHERCEWKGRAQAAQWAKPGGSMKRRPQKKKKLEEVGKEETSQQKKETKSVQDCSS